MIAIRVAPGPRGDADANALSVWMVDNGVDPNFVPRDRSIFINDNGIGYFEMVHNKKGDIKIESSINEACYVPKIHECNPTDLPELSFFVIEEMA